MTAWVNSLPTAAVIVLLSILIAVRLGGPYDDPSDTGGTD